MAINPGISSTKIAGAQDMTLRARAPRGEIGYAQVVANQLGITAETDLTNLTVTLNIPGRRRIKISVDALISRTVADGLTQLNIKEGATFLQIANVRPASIDSIAVHRHIIFTPTVGSHTYKITLFQSSGTGTSGLNAGATFPASITIEDIGAA